MYKGLPKRVLVVIDDKLIHNYLHDILNYYGVQKITLLESIHETIKHLQEHDYDIVLIDLYLYGFEDGVELARFITTHYGMPIIFLSSCYLPENVVDEMVALAPYGKYPKTIKH